MVFSVFAFTVHANKSVRVRVGKPSIMNRSIPVQFDSDQIVMYP